MWLNPGQSGGAAGVSADGTVSLSGHEAPDVVCDISASFAPMPTNLHRFSYLFLFHYRSLGLP